MAQQADGRIIIDTAIETDGMTAGGKEVEAAARRMADQVDKIGDSAKTALEKQAESFVKQNQAYAESEQKIKDLESQIKKLSETQIPTSEFKEIAKQIETDEVKLNKLKQAQEEFLAVGGKETSTAYQRRQLQIEELEKSIKYAKAEQADLISSGKAFTMPDTSALEEKAAAEKEKLQQRNIMLGLSYDALKAKVEYYTQKIIAEEAKITKKKEEEAKKQEEEAKKAAAANAELARLQNTFDFAEIADANIVKLNNELTELKNRLNDLKAAGVGYGFEEFDNISIRIAQINQEIKNYAASILQAKNGENQLEEETRSLEEDEENLEEHTGKLAEIFSTFGNVLGTIKETMIRVAKNGFSGVEESARKTNKTMGTSLKKILKYGLGIRSLFALLNKLRSAVKEGFENLAQVSGETNTSISSVSSALTRLKNSLATAFAPILNVVAPALTSMINLLSEATTKIGMFFATLAGQTSFTKAITAQEDYAASLSDTASSAKDAKKYLSGLDEIKTYTEDSSTSGTSGVSASDMFTTVDIDSQISDFGTRIKELIASGDWFGVGSELANKLNEAISNMDLTAAADSINEKLSNLFSVINGFISTLNWKSLGSNIGNFLFEGIKSFDVNGLVQTLSSAIIGAMNFVTGIIQGIDWKELPVILLQKIKDAITGINWIGITESLAELLGSAVGGLIAFLDGLAEKLWEVIQTAWASVVEWWKETAYEDGQFTIEGLFNGILEALKNVGAWIVEHIFTPFIDGFKKAFGIASPSKVMAEMGDFLMQGLFNGVQAMVDTVISLFTKIKEKISEVWDSIKEKTAEIWTKITNSVSGIWSKIKIGAGNFANSVKTTIVNVFTSLKNKVVSIWNGLMSAIKTPINGIIGFINTFVNGVADAINGVIGALNSISVTIPNWVPVYGGRYFGISLGYVSAPQIPYLASGAVIPPNAPFTAVLGDQKSGTNIETPEKLLRQIIREELGNQNQSSGGNYRFVAQINRRTLFDEMMTEAQLARSQTGQNPFEMA